MGYPLVWQFVTCFQKFGLEQQFGTAAGVRRARQLHGPAHRPATSGPSSAAPSLFCLVTAAVTVVIGVAARAADEAVGTVARLILQIALLLAWAMPVVAAMTVWIWLFDRRRGVSTTCSTCLGFDIKGHNWLAEPLTFFFVANVIVIWMSVPFVAFSVYAGLTQVSDEVLEAAAAGRRHRLAAPAHIILPMIRPVIAIVLLLQLIWDLRVFTQITLLQDAGGVASDTDLLGTYIYKLGIGSGDFGMATAVSIFVLVLTIALSWFYVAPC